MAKIFSAGFLLLAALLCVSANGNPPPVDTTPVGKCNFLGLAPCGLVCEPLNVAVGALIEIPHNVYSPTNSPSNSNDFLEFQIKGISGKFDASVGLTKFHLFVDADVAVGTAFVLEIAFDFTADGSWDRKELYSLFANDPVPGFQLWTELSAFPGMTSIGAFAELMVKGTIRVRIWSAFQVCCQKLRVGLAVGLERSYFLIPYVDTSITVVVGNPCGGAPPPTPNPDPYPNPNPNPHPGDCTRSHHYWKNHENNWPSTVHPTLDLELGVSLIVILRTPSRGLAWFILAKAYIAARINVELIIPELIKIQVKADIAVAAALLITFKDHRGDVPIEVVLALAAKLEIFNIGADCVHRCDDDED